MTSTRYPVPSSTWSASRELPSLSRMFTLPFEDTADSIEQPTVMETSFTRCKDVSAPRPGEARECESGSARNVENIAPDPQRDDSAHAGRADIKGRIQDARGDQVSTSPASQASGQLEARTMISTWAPASCINAADSRAIGARHQPPPLSCPQSVEHPAGRKHE